MIWYEGLEGAVTFATIVHRSSYYRDELIITDRSFTISIKQRKQLLHFCLGQRQLHISHCFFEFIDVQTFAVIIIHDAKQAGQPQQTTCTSTSQLQPQFVEQWMTRGNKQTSLRCVLFSLSGWEKELRRKWYMRGWTNKWEIENNNSDVRYDVRRDL